MPKMPAGYLRRIGRRIERAVIGGRRDVQRRDLAVGGRADLHVHVVVAREAGAREVLGARLDPLDRPSDLERADDRAHVSRIDRHLVAEAAAEVGRDRRGSCPRRMPVTSASAVR